MSELLQLLTMTPYPLPLSMVRIQSFATPDDEIDVSYCPSCKRDDLPLEAFYVRADGRCSSWCKKCTCANSARAQKLKKGLK